MFGERPLHRRANRLVCAVDAAYPATRPSHPVFELGHDALYMLLARCLLLDRNGPTDPLVSSERRNVLPCRERFWRSGERLLEVGRKRMYFPGRYLHCKPIVSKPSFFYESRIYLSYLLQKYIDTNTACIIAARTTTTSKFGPRGR